MPIGLVDTDTFATSDCEFIIWSKWKKIPPLCRAFFFNTAHGGAVFDGEPFSFPAWVVFLQPEWWQNFVHSSRTLSPLSYLGDTTSKKNCNIYLPCTDKWPLSFNATSNSRTSNIHLTFKSEEGGKGGCKFSRQGSISPEKRGILPSCFL